MGYHGSIQLIVCFIWIVPSLIATFWFAIGKSVVNKGGVARGINSFSLSLSLMEKHFSYLLAAGQDANESLPPIVAHESFLFCFVLLFVCFVRCF